LPIMSKPMASCAPTTCCAKNAAPTDAPSWSPIISRICRSISVRFIVIARR
jgi:hypothetical protein